MEIELNGITLGYDDRGHGLPLVLLHAFPLNRRMWAASAALAQHYRMITPDLRGHGDSEVVPSPALISDMADDVIKLLDALHIERTVIGGLSMGGYVALNIVARYAPRVQALILANTRAGADSAEGKRNRAILGQTALDAGANAIADQMIPKLLSAPAQRNRELVDHVRSMIIATDPRGIAAASQGMAARPDSTAVLGSINVPTLIIGSTDDAVIPMAESIAMHGAIANATLEIIPDAGHLSNLEQPESFNRALQSFLATLANTPNQGDAADDFPNGG